jgi:IS30 family transposase
VTSECPAQPWRDPEYLRMAYWSRDQSTVEIGEACGVNDSTVSKWMRRHGIPRRDSASVPEYSEAEILTDIAETDRQVDGMPSTVDHERHGVISHRTACERFDCYWREIVKKARSHGGESR